MICNVCYGVLRGHQGDQWRGTFDLQFDHQFNRLELQKSASTNCCICRSIFCELLRIEKKNPRVASRAEEGWYSYAFRLISGRYLRNSRQTLSDKSRPLISAYLSEVYGLKQGEVYRLDLKLRDSEGLGTFVLKETGDEERSLLHTPFSSSTESDEVLELAKQWINKCISCEHKACPGESSEPWYPSRLIDLRAEFKSNKPSDPRSDPVRLVLTNEERPEMNGCYVTLSHRWGTKRFIRLTDKKLPAFQESISMDSLPQTFRDAIYFARRLGSKVRYIWIDSLCIIQGNRKDWLAESAQMYKIYNHSYCNISATAAQDSTKGLFFDRKPEQLWEDEINLNVEGIPGRSEGQSRVEGIQGPGLKQPIKRCSILDLSFWERNVNNAPVNRRAWVLQERIMAPRVLHFCQDQIAWECRTMEAAESSIDGLPNFRISAEDIVSEGRLKDLVQDNDGKSPSTNTCILALNSWKRVVEVYSKTQLTNKSDKLIALSGIAEMMSTQVEGRYIAGLWEKYLASQLLWRVDPVYENGRFYYRSERPKDYRAPSFSWAAVDAKRGVTYGEITDQDLLIDVKTVDVTPETGKNDFGLVKDGHITLTGILKKIEMKQVQKNGSTRYVWQLERPNRGTGVIKHSIVCLDSPSSDPDIFGSNGRVYCLPARKDSSKYLICLLLQLERKDSKDTGNFRRIGWTKIPPYAKSGQDEMQKLSGDEASITYGEWDAEAKKHTICVV